MFGYPRSVSTSHSYLNECRTDISYEINYFSFNCIWNPALNFCFIVAYSTYVINNVIQDFALCKENTVNEIHFLKEAFSYPLCEHFTRLMPFVCFVPMSPYTWMTENISESHQAWQPNNVIPFLNHSRCITNEIRSPYVKHFCVEHNTIDSIPLLWLFTETKTKKAMKFTSNDGGGYFNTFLGNSIILTDSHVTRTFC